MIKKAAIYFSLLIGLTACQSPKAKLIESIDANEQKLFLDSTSLLNSRVAEDVLKSYREFAEKYPDDTLVVSYLFKAADLANGMRKFNDAIELYRQFIEKFPGHKKAGSALFLQAFIYDNSLQEKEKAKRIYSSFLEKYPSHELAPSAQASLDQINMGLTDEQLIKLFEARQDSLASASSPVKK